MLFYESKLISRGNNFPSINLSKNNLDSICVLLHDRRPLQEIQDILSISESQLFFHLDRLLEEELVKVQNDGYLPTFLVISKAEGEWLKEMSVNLGDEIAQLIVLNKQRILEETFKVSPFKQYSFEELSFFILSGVVLDFIQIDHVEELFLKAKRPSRSHKNYYFSLMEKEEGSRKEAFGIYGNHYETLGDVAFGVYGNERYTSPNLLTLSEGNLEKWINSPFSPKMVEMLRTLKLPILKKNEFQQLYQIAEVIKDDLINILNGYRVHLYLGFTNTPYLEESSFEEFFIWYYHFLYTYVTDQLIEAGEIRKPVDGLFQYIVQG